MFPGMFKHRQRKREVTAYGMWSGDSVESVGGYGVAEKQCLAILNVTIF